MMDAARFRMLEVAFAEVCALTGPARDQWLAEREATDPELASELRALLAAEAATGVLDRLGPHMSSLPRVLEHETSPAGNGSDRLPLPTHVGPYLLTAEIGRGGVGIVYRAHDPRLGRDVALKIFPHAAPGGAPTDTERRVLAEARAASALDHPHICTIYDVGALPDGRPYLAMAYYAGGTLADRLVAGPLPLRDAATIALQIADALACAHAAGMVHRDVKPHNVAFGERGESKLLDFGIALLRDQVGKRESAGTPAYMAPEQVRCEPVDGRADLWALGVVMFEMLTGRRPFAGADRGALLRAIVHDEPPNVRALRADAPPALTALLERVLRKAPGDRPAGAAEVASALRAVLADLDANPRAAAAAPATRARRTAAVGLAIVGVAAIGALLVRAKPNELLSSGGRPAASPATPAGTSASVAVLPFVTLDLQGRDSGSTYLADGMTEDVLTELARVPELHVRSRESVERYRDSTVDARAVAGALDVQYLLRGTVRRAGDQMRITARLTEVAGDRQVWAASYDRRITDLLAVQREIASEIARALGARVSAAPATGVSVDADTYDMFLRARARFHLRERQATEQAVTLLRAALARTPDFAQARALLARTYVSSVQVAQSREGRAEWLDSAVVEAKRAVSLAPAEPAGYAALGGAYAARGRYADAVSEYRRALDLDPRHAQAMSDLALSYMRLARFEEGIVWMERALAVDPTLPGARAVAASRYNAWEIPEHARRHIEAGLRLDPTDVDLRWQGVMIDFWIGDTVSARRGFDAMLPMLSRVDQERMSAWFEILRGDFPAARRHADRVLAGGASSYDVAMYGAMYRRTGARARSDSLLRRWMEVQRNDDRMTGEQDSGPPLRLAYAHAILGERDAAVRELARFDSLGGLTSWKRVNTTPGWESIRDDPRFRELLDRSQLRFTASRNRILAMLAKEGISAPARPSDR